MLIVNILTKLHLLSLSQNKIKLFHIQSNREDMDEAAMTSKLLGLLVKKTNGHFEKFCEALHETDQTHVVKNLLITPGNMIVHLVKYCSHSTW